MTDWFVDTFAVAQLWLFESAVQPVMLAAGLSGVLEEGFNRSEERRVGKECW